MREHLIRQFWNDYYECRDEQHTDKALKKLLWSFRQSLNIFSKTAHMIDNHCPLHEIIQCAKKEGYFEFAETLSIAEKHLD